LKKHTRIYLDHFDYGRHQDVFVPCEICGARINDVHHLDSKGMGGSDTKDYIENLIGVCRTHHVKCHADPEFNERAKELHILFLIENSSWKPPF